MYLVSLLATLSGHDWFGVGCMVGTGSSVLWFFNKFLHSKESLASLFAIWPKARPKEFGIWLATSAAIATGLYFLLTSENNLNRLVRCHEIAAGTFVKYEGQHAQFRYTFTVLGRQYHGYDGSDEHRLENIEAGEPFAVYYDPANPNINIVSEPRHRLSTEKEMVTFFCMLLMGLLAILIRKLGTLMRDSATA